MAEARTVQPFYYIKLPTADMRETYREDAKMVSQALFSEQIEVLEEVEDRIKIKTLIDNYQGWVFKKAIHQRLTPFIQDSYALVNRLSAHLYDRPDTEFGPMMTLPFESRLRVIDPKEKDSQTRWVEVRLPDDKKAFIQRGDVEFETPVLKKAKLEEWTSRFLGLPYTWGGRSSFGYDCSGFVQMVYRQMGHAIPRDSRDQANWEGFISKPLDQLQIGDIVFFGLASDKIRHVGLCLDGDRFIHSTVAENAPYIRISRLSDPEWNGSGKWIYRTARTLQT